MNLEKLRIAAALGALMWMVAEPAHAGIPNPIPEPTTLVLLGAGAATVGVVAWWRRRK
jgi:hypothetical protein